MSVTFASDRIEVIDASRRSDGLARVRATHPDAVLIDRRLPDGDGLWLVTKLRAMAAYSTLPIVVISSSFNAAERDKVIAAGATDCLLKPFDPETLVDYLEALVQHARANPTPPPPIRRRAEPLRATRPEPPRLPAVPTPEEEAALDERYVRERAEAAESRAAKALADADEARRQTARAEREKKRLGKVADSLRAELDQAMADRDEATDLVQQLERRLAQAEAEISRLEAEVVTAREEVDFGRVRQQLVERARKRLAARDPRR